MTADLTTDAGWADADVWTATSCCTWPRRFAGPAETRGRSDRAGPYFAAIGYGNAPPGRPSPEEDWTNPDGDVFGPVLGRTFSTSIQARRRGCSTAQSRDPRVAYSIVDVRDVADLHRLAMTEPAANWRAFPGAVAGEFMTVAEIAALLRERMGAEASKVPTRMLPSAHHHGVLSSTHLCWQIVPELGKAKQASKEGDATARLGAALERGGDRGERPKPCFASVHRTCRSPDHRAAAHWGPRRLLAAREGRG